MTYIEEFQGRFHGIMDWEQCFALFTLLIDNPEQWFVYDLEEDVPTTTLSAEEFIKLLSEIKDIIQTEHQERYCGIIYADDLSNPTMVKIFHPHHLGKSCGSSENPPLARWVISKTQPQTIAQEKPKKTGFFSFLR